MYNFQFDEYPEGIFTELDYTIVELAKFTEGDEVEIDGTGGVGVVSAVMTSNFEFPKGDGTKKVEASSENPVYIVATKSGMRAVSEDNLNEGSIDAKKKDVKKLANKSEMASVYSQMDDPYSTAELLNMPGVDDPEVGFSSLPKGWSRMSVLKAWSSLGGSFTSCRTDMAGEISQPSNFCAALKDEVLQTEKWRNRF